MDALALAAHLEAVVVKHLRRLEENRDFATAADPVEALHDLRVASRRLRAFSELSSGVFDVELRSRAEKTLKRITKVAGAVRDFDVQTGLLEGRRHEATDPERLALDHLLEWLGAGRERAARRAERKLSELDFDFLKTSMERVTEEVTESLRDSTDTELPRARSLLVELTHEADAHARPPEDDGDRDASLHRLRITIKHLRYSVELLEPMFGERFAPLDSRARELQELLGDHHDLVVLGTLLEDHAEALAEKKRRSLSRAVDLVRLKIQAEKYAQILRVSARGFDGEWWRARL